MFLCEGATGLSLDEVLDVNYLQHEVAMGFTRDGEAITLASNWAEGLSGEQVYFVVWSVDTERVAELWEFPDNYRGLHPIMFME